MPHYPFAQRQRAFIFPWFVTKPTFDRMSIDAAQPEIPKGDGVDLFINDITKIIDEPDLVPFGTFHHGQGKTVYYTATPNPPPGMPAGWTLDISEAIMRTRFRFRQRVITIPDLNRPRRRNTELEFGVTCTIEFLIRATDGGGNQCTIVVEGYWGYPPATADATEAFWEAQHIPPTVWRARQLQHADYTRQFTASDWVETVKTTTAVGTVPVDVGIYMNAWRDSLAADAAAATVDCIWRIAAIGYAIPVATGNRAFIIQSDDGRYY